MDAYRDPLGALRSQIMTRRMVIADVERGLLPLADHPAVRSRRALGASRRAFPHGGPAAALG